MAIRLCACGKCHIPCYKHGKIAKCDRCGKRRRLGTHIKGEVIQYICVQCIDELQTEQNFVLQKEINDALRKELKNQK